MFLHPLCGSLSPLSPRPRRTGRYFKVKSTRWSAGGAGRGLEEPARRVRPPKNDLCGPLGPWEGGGLAWAESSRAEPGRMCTFAAVAGRYALPGSALPDSGGRLHWPAVFLLGPVRCAGCSTGGARRQRHCEDSAPRNRTLKMSALFRVGPKSG